MAIQERKGNPLPFRVYWNNPFTGKRQSKSFKTKEEAEKHDALVKFQLQYEKDTFSPTEQKEENADDSLESTFYTFLKEKQFSDHGLSWQLDGMKTALSIIGRKKISAITKEDLSKVLKAETQRKIKTVTAAKHMSVLFSLLRWAVKRGYLASMPQTPDLPSWHYKKFVPPTPEELQRIMASASPHIQRVIILGAKLGMRVGPCELLKLRWEDVDLKRGIVRVQAANKNKEEPYREVPIMNSLLPVFALWHDEDEAKGIEYVVSWKGKRISKIYPAWRRTLRRAGIERTIRPYDLRHAFATDAIAAGADIGTVSRLMGHASVQMVLKHYQHVATKQKKQAIEALPEISLESVPCAWQHVPDKRSEVLQ